MYKTSNEVFVTYISFYEVVLQDWYIDFTITTLMKSKEIFVIRLDEFVVLYD